MIPALLVSSGEPAGVGPELMYALAQRDYAARLVVLGSLELLRERLPPAYDSLKFVPYDPLARPDPPFNSGRIEVIDIPLAAKVIPGRYNPANAPYVLSMLDEACRRCLCGEFDGVVTAPVSKGVIAQYGVPFTGHTEYLQQKCGVNRVVMMLGCRELKVALATTHLPLRQVADAITPQLLTEVVTILHRDLQRRFGLKHPLIVAAGLNPHAGEDGHLGTEERDIIIPTFDKLRQNGIDIRGPYPADTMFRPQLLESAAVFLTMYHDQGLPVLKYVGFDHGYNTTLGLPFIRTSVDHGTAMDLAGTYQADPRSLSEAVELAIRQAHCTAEAQV